MSNLEKCNKATLTSHAKERLQERTSISYIELARILDNNLAVNVGHEYPSNRYSRLVFSPTDKEFFIVVQDASNGTVVTILTIEYWNNLSEKQFAGDLTKIGKTCLMPWKRKITKKELMLAAGLSSDPESHASKNSRLSKSISITGTYEYLGFVKYVGFGKIAIDRLLNPIDTLVGTELKETIKLKLFSRNVSESDLVSINWKFKHDKSRVVYDCLGRFDVKKILKSIRKKVSQRIN
jgi:hypothetical protein